VRFDMEAEAIEFGGLRVPSVITENLESFHGAFLCGEPNEFPEARLLLISLLDPPLAVEYRFLTELGTPSHFEFTLGTSEGSLWPT
jgi:hypothetical protein